MCARATWRACVGVPAHVYVLVVFQFYFLIHVCVHAYMRAYVCAHACVPVRTQMALRACKCLVHACWCARTCILYGAHVCVRVLPSWSECVSACTCVVHARSFASAYTCVCARARSGCLRMNIPACAHACFLSIISLVRTCLRVCVCVRVCACFVRGCTNACALVYRHIW